MQTDFALECQRMREHLAAAHPGKLFLTLEEACGAMGIASKTLRNWRSSGVSPLHVSRMGQKQLVAVTHLAETAARIALGEDVTAPPRPRSAMGDSVDQSRPGDETLSPSRRGRPTNAERKEAKARGMTVSQLRASRQNEAGQPHSSVQS